jgi:hypothetical protein
MLQIFKIFFYMDSHVDKLFGKQHKVVYFITISVIVWRDNECKIVVKWNDGGRWSFDGLMLWLVRRQNRHVVEWWWEWSILRRSFHSNGEWESSGPRRVGCGGGADSMLQFRLKRGGNGTKCCQKMKQRQWAHLGSMGRKRDTLQQRGDID